MANSSNIHLQNDFLACTSFRVLYFSYVNVTHVQPRGTLNHLLIYYVAANIAQFPFFNI